MTSTRPILFSGPMIRALLDGRKTQTRRAIKPQPACGCYYAINGTQNAALHMARGESGYAIYVPPKPSSKDHRLTCPFGKPGGLLWVRETFSIVPDDDEPGGCSAVLYSADNEQYGRLRPSIHMPRWASRLTLEISDVQVERLQDISAGDAVAEGISQSETDCDGQPWYSLPEWDWQLPSSVRAYQSLWESINGPGSWEANPWVWVLTFQVHRQNVDDLLRARAA